VIPIYQLWKKQNSKLTERELSIAIFNQNFKTLSNPQERARIKTYFEKYPEPSNLLETCIAIVMIEFNVDVNDKKSYKYIRKVLLVKLYKNGYQIEGEK